MNDVQCARPERREPEKVWHGGRKWLSDVGRSWSASDGESWDMDATADSTARVNEGRFDQASLDAVRQKCSLGQAMALVSLFKGRKVSAARSEGLA
jgi:hypothetical protein